MNRLGDVPGTVTLRGIVRDDTLSYLYYTYLLAYTGRLS